MPTEHSDHEFLKRADELQREAERIINKLGIFSILEKISDPSVIGSVKNGLMVWPDIDIQAYMEEMDINKVTGLLKEFALLPTIQKVQLSNFREFRRDSLKSRARFPRAYYVGLRSIQPSGEWKMDIWFGKKGTPLNDYELPDPSGITEKQRVAILKLKKAWLDGKGGYKDGLISTDFYKAVLEYGAADEEGFRSYLKKRTIE
jgi:hypothetical protein